MKPSARFAAPLYSMGNHTCNREWAMHGQSLFPTLRRVHMEAEGTTQLLPFAPHRQLQHLRVRFGYLAPDCRSNNVLASQTPQQLCRPVDLV